MFGYIVIIILFSSTVYFFIPYWKDRTAIKRFHSFYKQEEEKPEMEVVYVDRLGNNWYQFKDLMKAPAGRTSGAEAMSKWQEMNMTADYMALKLNEAINLINKAKQVQAGAVLNEMLVRATWAAERVSLENLANQLFLLDGENPLAATQEFMDRKKAIWKQDPDCEGFFLHRALLHTRHLGELSASGLVSYLNQKEIENSLTKTSRFSTLS